MLDWAGADISPITKEARMRSSMPQIADLRQEMDRLFGLAFVSRWDEFPATRDSVPSLELTETGDALVLKMEVPGMNATFKNGRLVVTLPRTPGAMAATIPVKPGYEIVLPA
jgi:HSP20 family molecular chaperone IbpA